MVKSGQIWRHYKSEWWNHHTYEIIWLGKHSEMEELYVIYKPLFDAEWTWLWDAQFAIRPLVMRSEDVGWKGNKMMRFTLVKDV